MDIRLTEEQHGELVETLQESAEIARLLRERIADEDSIVLLQDIERAAALLGIPLPQRPGAAEADSAGGPGERVARG